MQTAHQHQRRSPAWLKIAVLLVVAVGVLLRFTNLDNKPFWWDETIFLLWSGGYTIDEVKTQLRSPPRVKQVDQVLQLQRAHPERGLKDITRPIGEKVIHPPLFPAVSYLWQRHVGDSRRLIRALPALLSLLVLPAAWWFCRELFGSSRVAWLTVSLLSISPLHVAYAQEVKQYSLWTALVLATGAALLRALDGGSRRAWLLFSAATIVSLYTHLLTGFLLIGLGAYVLFRERCRLTSGVKAFLISSAVAALAFAPWLPVFTKGQFQLTRLQAWTGERASLGHLYAGWSENLSRMVFDFSNLPARVTEGPADEIGFALVALLCAYAVWVLARKQDRRGLCFLLALAVPGAAILAGWDVLQGGIRSTAARFLIPSYLGLQIAIAHLFSEKLHETSSGRLKSLWIVALIALWCLGGMACWANSQSNHLWSKPQSGSIHRAGVAINTSPSALVLYSGMPVLSLAWQLDPDVKLMDAGTWWREERMKTTRSSSEIYVYAPPKSVAQQLSLDHDLSPAIGGEGERPPGGTILYRLTSKTKAP